MVEMFLTVADGQLNRIRIIVNGRPGIVLYPENFEYHIEDNSLVISGFEKILLKVPVNKNNYFRGITPDGCHPYITTDPEILKQANPDDLLKVYPREWSWKKFQYVQKPGTDLIEGVMVSDYSKKTQHTYSKERKPFRLKTSNYLIKFDRK